MDKELQHTEKPQNFFSNREIWQQVFGKDGRGGAIGELDSKIDSKFDELNETMCAEFKTSQGQLTQIFTHLNEHNGLHPKIEELETLVTDHICDWNKFAESIRTEEAIEDRLSTEHKRGVDDADAIFNKRIKLVGVYIGAGGFVLAIVTLIIRFMVF